MAGILQGKLTKAKVEVERSPDPQAAYLGPRLWEKPISLQQFNEDDFFVMNIDEFLTENNLSMESKEGLNHPLKVFFLLWNSAPDPGVWNERECGLVKCTVVDPDSIGSL
jgi:hypothetical protein